MKKIFFSLNFLMLLLSFGCTSSPDYHQVTTNAPEATVFVLEKGARVDEFKAGEGSKKLGSDSVIEVEAKGYLSYYGPLEELKKQGDKSWHIDLEPLK